MGVDDLVRRHASVAVARNRKPVHVAVVSCRKIFRQFDHRVLVSFSVEIRVCRFIDGLGEDHDPPRLRLPGPDQLPDSVMPGHDVLDAVKIDHHRQFAFGPLRLRNIEIIVDNRAVFRLVSPF